MKTAEFGFWPEDVGDVTTAGFGDDPTESTDTPFGFALHVMDTLLQDRQLLTYMKTGGFVADAFMADQLMDLLKKHGYTDLTAEQVWAMTADVLFGNFDVAPDDISELDGTKVPVAA